MTFRPNSNEFLCKRFNIRANFIEVLDSWFPLSGGDQYVFFDIAEESGTFNFPQA